MELATVVFEHQRSGVEVLEVMLRAAGVWNLVIGASMVGPYSLPPGRPCTCAAQPQPLSLTL